MAVFDESKVINALHTDRAEVGKKYWFSDSISILKSKVEGSAMDKVRTLDEVILNSQYPFRTGSLTVDFMLIYPYEEQPKKRMTNRQLAEWLARGNGQYMLVEKIPPMTYFQYDYADEDDEVDAGYDFVIRSWGSDEWVKPTVDIYERDCK